MQEEISFLEILFELLFITYNILNTFKGNFKYNQSILKYTLLYKCIHCGLDTGDIYKCEQIVTF